MRLLLCCILSLILLPSLRGLGNAAQPGIFGAGGAANFVLIYPQDSNAFRKIQMVAEKITIQLYRGFGVVKGEYKMYNTTDSAVNIRVGYPVNATLKGTAISSKATNIFFDQLYALTSYTNGKENSLIIQPGAARMSLDENNWYIWQSTFKPKDTTTIEVYFIVNTNNTTVREGYTIDNNNGFVYLLETGATWKQPIVKGEIKIGLMDDIKIKDIRGLLPSSVFKINSNNNTLLYKFNDLSPTAEDNIVLVYTPNLDKFDFGYIVQRRLLLYGSIDTFSKQSVDESQYTTTDFKDPYKVRSVSFTSLFVIAGLIGAVILGLILAVWLLRWLIRFLRSQRPSRGTEM